MGTHIAPQYTNILMANLSLAAVPTNNNFIWDKLVACLLSASKEMNHCKHSLGTSRMFALTLALVWANQQSRYIYLSWSYKMDRHHPAQLQTSTMSPTALRTHLLVHLLMWSLPSFASNDWLHSMQDNHCKRINLRSEIAMYKNLFQNILLFWIL